MDRRKLLRSLAAGLTVAVAGCGGDSETPTESPSSPAPTEPTPTPTPSQSPAETSTATPTSDTATPTPDRTATPTPDQTATPTPDPVAQTVEVGAEGGFSFAPESFTVAVGDTVEWTWVGSNHNVTANATPSGADWTGTPGAPDRTFDEGYSYRYTFEVPGEYTYYCNPHRSAGMTGSFTVTE